MSATTGKIVYTPISTRAIILDGTHYLSIADSDFNPDTQNFSIHFLGAINPSMAEASGHIAEKAAANLAGARGWRFHYQTTTRQLAFVLNDGGVAELGVATPNNAIPAFGTKFYAVVEVDRSVGVARFYVDGSLVSTGDISAKTGSLDNSEPLVIGSYLGSQYFHKGTIDLLRFDVGRVLLADWHSEEWDRIRYGWPRDAQDFLAFWDFEDSLIDSSPEGYTLTWQGGGSPSYEDGYPTSAAPLTLSFTYGQLKFGVEDLEIEGEDSERSLDGTLQTYHYFNKRRFTLPFEALSLAQRIGFRSAWMAGGDVDVYLDTDRPRSFQGHIVAPPDLREEAVNLIHGEVEIEEI